jgi:methionine sulfoxide reductase heme-binding subunit
VIATAAVSAGPHVFWITSRAAGTVALVLSSLAVGAGILIGARGGALRGFGGDTKALHEALSLATLIAVAVHGLALLGDHYLHPTVFDISIPFTGGYRPFWTGIGVVAGWGLAALGLSYYARASIGQGRWRSLHRYTALFWLLGIGHSLGAGTDAGQLWFLAMLAIPAAPALVLLLGRLSRGRPRPAALPSRRAAYGKTVSPVSSSTIEIATAGQASAASRINS